LSNDATKSAMSSPGLVAGSLFIIAAPSGAGKSTLTKALLAREGWMRLSISFTTRKPRPGEENGREYHFVDLPTFDAMRTRGDFLESAQVHNNYYATSRPWIEKEMAGGHDILLEIDWQGAVQVKQQFPEAVSIFILPPSMDELERRLRSRATDSEDTINVRLSNASGEIAQAGRFDYCVINNDFDRALLDLVAIVRAARSRAPNMRARHPGLFAPAA
jgi:guanylate kinase